MDPPVVLVDSDVYSALVCLATSREQQSQESVSQCACDRERSEWEFVRGEMGHGYHLWEILHHLVSLERTVSQRRTHQPVIADSNPQESPAQG